MSSPAAAPAAPAQVGAVLPPRTARLLAACRHFAGQCVTTYTLYRFAGLRHEQDADTMHELKWLGLIHWQGSSVPLQVF